MPRKAEPYTLIKRPRTKYWYYKLAGWTSYLSTGQLTKAEAMKFVQAILDKNNIATEPVTVKKITLGQYLKDYFVWDKCPHIRRLLEDGKSVGKRHAKDCRNILENHILNKPITKKQFAEIRRADILDLRSLLIKETGTRTVNKAISILKTVFKEALFREEIDRDPTAGIGNVKYVASEIGIFSIEELRCLFPDNSLGPWKDQLDYSVFLLAVTTGMRRGEILALTWKMVNFTHGCIDIKEAIKDFGTREIGKPKWNRVRKCPIPQKTQDALKSLYNTSNFRKPGDFVFCYEDGSGLGGTWWKKRFNRAIDSVKLADNKKIDRTARNLRPHSFRHTLNTILRGSGYDPTKIRNTLGWTTEKVQDRYTHLQIEHLQDQAVIVDGVFK